MINIYHYVMISEKPLYLKTVKLPKISRVQFSHYWKYLLSHDINHGTRIFSILWIIHDWKILCLCPWLSLVTVRTLPAVWNSQKAFDWRLWILYRVQLHHKFEVVGDVAFCLVAGRRQQNKKYRRRAELRRITPWEIEYCYSTNGHCITKRKLKRK
jgi:hypothetical protein